ncbi:MAG TPA: glycosyltransferase family 4 protein [Gemmatimonadaceae bacterium]|nr:glycosyltransferase family 4 protein [Gemmatimonadaceae bacterium]
MRVLMSADAVGGVWTYALALADALRPHGVTVELATMGQRPSARQRAAAERCGVAAVHESDFRLEWMQDSHRDFAASGEWLLELAERTACDIVHLNGFAHGAVRWRVPSMMAAHSCVLSWWRAVHGVRAPAEWDWYRGAVRNGLDAAALVVSPTRALLSLMSAEHGPIARSRVIHNGLNIPSVTRVEKEPLVLACGRFLDEGKNLSTLRKVAPRLSWPLLVAGFEGMDADGMTALGKLDREAVLTWQRRAAILVHPARYEPFGLVPLEAATACCALVLADIPSLRELWDGAALFAASDDADGIAAAVNRLIADPRLRTAMGARAARRARAFTASAMGSSYACVYGELLDRVQHPGELACAS